MDCLLCATPLEQAPFPLCDPQTQEVFTLLRCQHCKLGQTAPQPPDLAPYYSTYYGQRHGFSARFCLRRRLAWLRKMNPGKIGKLLDIGCGDGQFLQQAARAGWQVAGVERELSPARTAGFTVVEELRDLADQAPFDCITLWHSLEHLRSPQTTLKEAHALLAPQGCLLIAVPNAQGWQARLFGEKWLHWDAPRHLYHFGPQSLQALLKATNFEPLRWWHQEFEYDLLGWSQSALNCLFKTPNLFFQELTGKHQNISPGRRLFTWAGGLLFSALALPLLPLSAFYHAGGTVVVAARHVAHK